MRKILAPAVIAKREADSRVASAASGERPRWVSAAREQARVWPVAPKATVMMYGPESSIRPSACWPKTVQPAARSSCIRLRSRRLGRGEVSVLGRETVRGGLTAVLEPLTFQGSVHEENTVILAHAEFHGNKSDRASAGGGRGKVARIERAPSSDLHEVGPPRVIGQKVGGNGAVLTRGAAADNDVVLGRQSGGEVVLLNCRGRGLTSADEESAAAVLAGLADGICNQVDQAVVAERAHARDDRSKGGARRRRVRARAAAEERMITCVPGVAAEKARRRGTHSHAVTQGLTWGDTVPDAPAQAGIAPGQAA